MNLPMACLIKFDLGFRWNPISPLAFFSWLLWNPE